MNDINQQKYGNGQPKGIPKPYGLKVKGICIFSPNCCL